MKWGNWIWNVMFVSGLCFLIKGLKFVDGIVIMRVEFVYFDDCFEKDILLIYSLDLLVLVGIIW